MLSGRSAIRAAGLGAEPFQRLLLADHTQFPYNLDPAWEFDFELSRIVRSSRPGLRKWSGTLSVINKPESISILSFGFR
jgi:hypothetical protein